METEPVKLMRKDYVRPFWIALILCLAAELGLWVSFGLIIFPSGNPGSKLIWAVVCSIGMGSVIGTFTILLVVGQLWGKTAFLATTLISSTVLIGCVFLCFRLDHYYHFWGTVTQPELFLVNGIIWAIIGYKWLLPSHVTELSAPRIEATCPEARV